MTMGLMDPRLKKRLEGRRLVVPPLQRKELNPEELKAFLTITPHPQFGYAPFWRVDVVPNDESRTVRIVAKVDPLIMEVSGLKTIQLRKYLKDTIEELKRRGHLPQYNFSVIVKKLPKMVLGTLALGRREDEDEGPAHDHDCPYCPSSR